MRRVTLLASCLALVLAGQAWADAPETGPVAAAAPKCCDQAECDDPACEKHAHDEEVQYIVSDEVLGIDMAIPAMAIPAGDLGHTFKFNVGWQRGGAGPEQTKSAPTYSSSPANAYADPSTACEPSYGYVTSPPSPYAPAYPRQTSPDEDVTARKIEHLRQAAEHFRTAGKPELAGQIHAEAQRVAQMHARVQQRLAELTAERDRIDHEIQQLRQTGQLAPRQVLLDVQVIDLDLKKLNSVGLAIFPLESLAKKSLPEFVETLRENGLATVISAPKLTTISGRPAKFQVGSGSPIAKTAYSSNVHPQYYPATSDATEMEFSGTQVEFLPEVLSDDTIRMHIKLHVSSPKACPDGAASKSGVAVADFSLETMIETKPGEVTLLNRTGGHGCAKATTTVGAPPAPAAGCPADCDKHASHVERIVLIRPTLVDGLPPARPWIHAVPHPVMPAQAVWPIPQHVLPHPPVAAPAPVPPPAPVVPPAPATATLPNPYAF